MEFKDERNMMIDRFNKQLVMLFNVEFDKRMQETVRDEVTRQLRNALTDLSRLTDNVNSIKESR